MPINFVDGIFQLNCRDPFPYNIGDKFIPDLNLYLKKKSKIKKEILKKKFNL